MSEAAALAEIRKAAARAGLRLSKAQGSAWHLQFKGASGACPLVLPDLVAVVGVIGASAQAKAEIQAVAVVLAAKLSSRRAAR